MADYIVNITAKDNISNTLSSVKQEFNNIGNSAKNSAKEIDKVGKNVDVLGDKSKILERAKERFDKITQSTAPAKKQLRDIQMLMTNMNLNGLSNTGVFTEMAEKAGELRDAITDTQQAISSFANDEQNLEAISQGFQGIAAATSIATGAMGLFGTKNEELMRILVKVQSAQAMLNGVTTIAKLVNKDSTIALKIKKIWLDANAAAEARNTAATTKNTVATGANTVATTVSTAAQHAWNVAKAIGMAMFGNFTGLLLLGIAGLTAYALATDDATDSEENRNKTLTVAQKLAKERQETEKAMATATASAAAQQLGAYFKLQQKWKECNRDIAKQKIFMNEHKEAIKQTGFAVDDLKSAEDFFVNNTGAVVQAIMQRARAQAAYEIMVDKLKVSLEKLEEKSQRSGDYMVTPKFTNITNEERKYLNDLLGDNAWKSMTTGRFTSLYQSQYTGRSTEGQKTPYDLSEEGYKALRQKRIKEAQERKKDWQSSIQNEIESNTKFYADIVNDANGKLADIQNKYGLKASTTSTTSGSSNSKKEPEAIKGSIAEMEQTISDLQSSLRKGLIPDSAIDNTNATINQLKERIKNEEIRLGLVVEPTEGSLVALQKELSKLQNDLKDGLIDDVDSAKNRINELNNQILHKKIELGFDDSLNKLHDKLDNIEITPKISSFESATATNKYDYNLLDEDDYSGRLSSIQSIMDYNDQLIEQLRSLQEEYRKLGVDGENGLAQVSSKIQEVEASQKNLTIAAQDYNEKQKEQDEQKERTEKLAQAYQIAGDAVNNLGSVFSNLGSITNNVQLQAAGIIANAVATMIQSYTTAAAQASKMGPWVWAGFAVSGLAQLTSVVSQIKSLGAYANGGIITGSSTMGDHLLARVNAGEMILNGRQQKNLFNAIDDNRLGGGSNIVCGEIKIKGSDLYVALKNYGKVQKGIGKNIGIM